MFFLPLSDYRVSDADRDAAVDFLNRHYAAGRLDDEELSARVDAAYRARFDSQLERLTADLPDLPVAMPRAPGRSLGPVAKAGALGAALVALALVMPPELWALLLGLGLPMLFMVLFAVAPLALPVIAFLWLARGSVHQLEPQRGRRPSTLTWTSSRTLRAPSRPR